MGIESWFGWKQALIVQTIFYSLGLLQQDFYLGQLWFIINCFTLLLLLRAAYSESPSSRLMAWYIYCLSIFTDLISLITFGNDLTGGGVVTFVLVMAIFLLLPKPLFLFFLYKHLKDEGVDIKQGVKRDPLAEHMVNSNPVVNNDNNNVGNNYYGVPISNQQRFSQQSNMNNDPNNTQDFLNSNDIYSQQRTQNNNAQQTSNDYDVFTPGQNV